MLKRSECVLALVCLLTVASPTAADDLADLQGKWEMKQTRDGVERRIVKTIEGNTETLEAYLDGRLVQKHRVDFELQSHGPAKVFVWSNGRITEGPRAGQNLPDGRFLYRLESNRWIGVHGMLEGDRTGVQLEVFERIRPPAETEAV